MIDQAKLGSSAISRRQAMRLGAGAMLAAGFWPGWAEAAADDAAGGEDFTFLCVNDLHFFDDKCVPFFQQMARQMKATEDGADFCLVVGDLAEDGKTEQFKQIRDILKTLEMPTPVVVGNHDYVAGTDRKAFETFFPDSINYHFDHKGWQFFGLDTTQGRQGSGTSIQRETLAWLKDNVPKIDARRPTVLFTHFPLGFLVPCRPSNADAVLEPLRHSNLRAVFNGHFHAFTERPGRGFQMTTDKCCSFHHANHDGTPEKGYFLCKAKDGKVERTFVEVKLPPKA